MRKLMNIYYDQDFSENWRRNVTTAEATRKCITTIIIIINDQIKVTLSRTTDSGALSVPLNQLSRTVQSCSKQTKLRIKTPVK